MKTKLVAALLTVALSGTAAATTTSLSFSSTGTDTFIDIQGQGKFDSVFALTPSLTNSLLMSFSALDGDFSAVSYSFYSDASLTANVGLASGYLIRTTELTTDFAAAGASLIPFSDADKASFNLSGATPYYVRIRGTLNDKDGFGQLKVSVGNALVTAVPEPESYAMLLAGLGVMATIARRRNRSTKD